MSALGHELPRELTGVAAALPPKAAAVVSRRRVRFGPIGDIANDESPVRVPSKRGGRRARYSLVKWIQRSAVMPLSYAAGMPITEAATINADLLEFIKS